MHHFVHTTRLASQPIWQRRRFSRVYPMRTLDETTSSNPQHGFWRSEGCIMESQVFHDTTTLSVARIGEELTLKRYYRQNGYGSLELQPVSSNTDHSTIDPH